MTEILEYDVVVIGGGIAGMQSSLDLADMGFRILLVEKEASIGGHMFKLSKTFPTMDCASCISTPKMAAVSHHPNITVWTYSEVEEVVKNGEGDFRLKIIRKPRFVDESKCTGCEQCEDACPVIVPNEYNFGLIGRKAAYIPFETAVPKVAVIDMDNCILCGACERVCPANAINFFQEPEAVNVKAGAVILATGYKLFPAELKKEYHFGEYPNVITSMQAERLLSPTRPFNSLLRPRDGKEPMNIAYILCVGSRDRTIGNPLCSQICCMYSIKQAQLIMGTLPLADVTIYYMDIRAFGKGYEEFYQQTRAMGVNFVRGRVAKIEETENGDLVLHYTDVENGCIPKTQVHDLVVLSVGIWPNSDIAKIFSNEKLELDNYGWIKRVEEYESPNITSIPGVFTAGCVTGPKDIPDSIVDATSAAAECADYLSRFRRKLIEISKKEMR